MDTIDIGPSPCEEACAQFGVDNNYAANARIECKAFRNQIARHYGNPPEGSRLKTVSNRYEGGTYYEVGVEVCDRAGYDYAYQVEHDEKGVLREWDEQARDELRAADLFNDTVGSC